MLFCGPSGPELGLNFCVPRPQPGPSQANLLGHRQGKPLYTRVFPGFPELPITCDNAKERSLTREVSGIEEASTVLAN